MTQTETPISAELKVSSAGRVLEDNELDAISGGGAKNSANNTTKGSSESLSLNFTEIHFSYSY